MSTSTNQFTVNQPAVVANPAHDSQRYQSIHQLLRDHARIRPDAVAITAPDRPPLTYARLLAHVTDVVATLNRLGIGRGDRVAIVLPNGPEMAVSFLAVAAGATSAPLNPAYRASNFEFYLGDLEAKALILFSGSDSPARSVANKLEVPVIELACQSDQPAGVFTLAATNETGPAEKSGFATTDEVALVLHTSGTTSRPKMVPLSQRNVCASAANIAATIKLSEKDRCLNVMPLFHIHGLIGATLSSAMAGASVVCTPGFDAAQFFNWIKAFEPTWYTAVPTMHQAILAQAEDNKDTISQFPLRLIRSSSSSLPPQVMEDLEKTFGAPVIESYGMTEASHQMTSNPLPPAARKPGSVGPAAGPEVAVMDANGKLLSNGETGEIVIRGSNITKGYQNNPEANQDAFSEGWFRTGDQGCFDADGYLSITGRIKEMINRGGENIAPREIDEVFLKHPNVAQATAFAVAHPTLGEDVAVAVVVKNNDLHTKSDSTANELREYAFASLADFKVPSQVIIVDEIPKGPTGKLQRIGLADKLSAQLKSDYVAPRIELEEKLSQVWAETLGVDRVGIRDNFFTLGGDSLAAARLFTHIDKIAGRKLPLATLFRAPTVGQLAVVIKDKRDADVTSEASETPTNSSDNWLPKAGRWGSFKNRIFQLVALYAPGMKTTRAKLHRMRGVDIGENVAIGTSVIIETKYPKLVSIGNNATLGIRTVIIAHYRGSTRSLVGDQKHTVLIEDNAYIGPGVIILPNVTIGEGAVVAAGSVVTKSVPPQTMVRGNPAEPVAHCEVPFTESYEEFARNLKPLRN